MSPRAPTPALPPEPPRGPTALRILEAAEALFAEQGFRGTSLSQVSDAVGIRGPSLFNHFASKRELYEAVLDRLLTPFFAMLHDLGDDASDPARQDAVLRRMLEHHARHPRLASILQHAVLAGGEQLDLLVERWYAPFFAAVASARAKGAGEPDPPAVTMAFNALILGYVTLAPLHARLLGLDPLAPDAVVAYGQLLSALRAGLPQRP